MHSHLHLHTGNHIFFSFVLKYFRLFLKKAHKHSEKSRQNLTNLSDEELIASLSQQTYNETINEIFNRYSHILYGLCYKYLKNTEESKDAVQSIFEKIFTDIGNHSIRNLKSWLFVVAKNYCLMHIRKKQIETKELTAENSSSILLKLYEEEVGQKIENEEQESQVNELLRCIDKLTSQQSICINLMYLDDKSYKEIAEITGFTLNEVKSYIQNGKRNLRKLLIENDEE